MPDGAGGARLRIGMGPNWNEEHRAVLRSKGLGCGAGRDGEDRRLKPGRAVPVGVPVGDREWDKAGNAGLMVPPVRRLVSAEATVRVVVFRAKI